MSLPTQSKLQIKMNKTGHSRHLTRSLLAIFKKKKKIHKRPFTLLITFQSLTQLLVKDLFKSV